MIKISELKSETQSVILRLLHELTRHPVKPHRRGLPVVFGKNKSVVLINPTMADVQNNVDDRENSLGSLTKKKVAKSEIASS
jgi:glycosylphosphatidylinositol transamidase (GPIT) subunit GPI8